MDRAIRHRDIGLIAVGDDFFQAELTVAEHCDEGNEHGLCIDKGRSGPFYHAVFVPAAGAPGRVTTGDPENRKPTGPYFVERREGLPRARPPFSLREEGWIRNQPLLSVRGTTDYSVRDDRFGSTAGHAPRGERAAVEPPRALMTRTVVAGRPSILETSVAIASISASNRQIMGSRPSSFSRCLMPSICSG